MKPGTTRSRLPRKCRLRTVNATSSPYFDGSPPRTPTSDTDFEPPLDLPKKSSKVRGRRKNAERTPNSSVPKETAVIKTAGEGNETSDDDWDKVPARKDRKQKNKTRKPRRTNQAAPTTQITTKPEPSRSASSSEEEGEWEEVVETSSPRAPPKEVEFMSQLLTATKPQPGSSSEEEDDENLVISVSIGAGGRQAKSLDPKLAAAMLRARRLREKRYARHVCHLLCLLSHARVANLTCDNDLIRGLGLSLLTSFEEVRDSLRRVLPSNNWGLSDLRLLLLAFVCHITATATSTTEYTSLAEAIDSRLQARKSTLNDVTVLLVAALRTIGLDTRLVCALQPLPLKLPSALRKRTKRPSTSPSATRKKLKPLGQSVKNDKILSASSCGSAESDCEGHLEDAAQEASLVFFAEVFLPSTGTWVGVNLQPPVGRVDADFFQLPFPYVVGFASNKPVFESSSSVTHPYTGRFPLDLASRYDPHWLSSSRPSRIADPLWKELLDQMKGYCDADAALLGGLRAKEPTMEPEVRDAVDAERIQSCLRQLPLPRRVSDLKNHPLYVLKRHLLKFEVIHPPDAPVVGFLKVGKSDALGEPIFSREYLYLCHTREAWLKEAKVVRIGEKPAKVVKALMSMKRKLLCDAGGPPPTVELFGPWQVEDYVPPVAQNGVVPRNEHGNVELFKPSMLPIGCVHICLSGIQHIAKRLEIDAVPAMIGWSFHGGGWAHPEYNGFVVCKESVPALLDAWRADNMNKAKAAAADCTERALANWRRLTRHLLLWQRVEARFQLSRSSVLGPSHAPSQLASSARASRGARRARAGSQRANGPAPPMQAANGGGWQRLNPGEESVFPRLLEVAAPAQSRAPCRPPRGAAGLKRQTRGRTGASTRGRRRRTRRKASSSSSSSEAEDHMSWASDSST
ncbi:hypothetical protein AAHC03_016598 [Spirometra sp. Aus1]